ncbi:BMC domain-containing protein [Siminovitchia sediminis]|uniref:BMC domain-containing protein n=1 Tax=Siminovitchia sediminis TaxID=1274353 RepID=A0ABW4KEU0_9BACI
MFALGLIETVGYTTAVSAADAAVKAADVEIIGMEKVIGVSGYVGVTIHITGDVAAVTSAVEAGREQGELVGKVISTDVIPRAHSEVNLKLLSKFMLDHQAGENSQVEAKPAVSSSEAPIKEVRKSAKSTGTPKTGKGRSKAKDSSTAAADENEMKKNDLNTENDEK